MLNYMGLSGGIRLLEQVISCTYSEPGTQILQEAPFLGHRSKIFLEIFTQRLEFQYNAHASPATGTYRDGLKVQLCSFPAVCDFL